MPEQEVIDTAQKVDETARLKMTKVLKDKHLLAYVRELHDREARTAQCPRCAKAGFDDWLHFGAHLRTHVLDVMLSGDCSAKEATVALQTLRDTDKVQIPVEKHQAEIEIPGGQENLLRTLGAALGRRQRVLESKDSLDQDTATPTESSPSDDGAPDSNTP